MFVTIIIVIVTYIWVWVRDWLGPASLFPHPSLPSSLLMCYGEGYYYNLYTRRRHGHLSLTHIIIVVVYRVRLACLHAAR